MKKIIFGALILLVIFGLQSCIYDFVAPEETAPIDTTVPVSFATQIQPVFTANCILCHKTGGTSPDLSAGNAYSSINSSKYINTTSPAQSLIYRRVIASGGFTGHLNLPSAQAAILLAWITQGAKNN
jgi:mono/diheme cytochrome c family protein